MAETGMECWSWAGRDDPLMYGMPLGQNFTGGQTSGEWQVAAQALVVVVPAGFCHVLCTSPVP